MDSWEGEQKEYEEAAPQLPEWTLEAAQKAREDAEGTAMKMAKMMNEEGSSIVEPSDRDLLHADEARSQEEEAAEGSGPWGPGDGLRGDGQVRRVAEGDLRSGEEGGGHPPGGLQVTLLSAGEDALRPEGIAQNDPCALSLLGGMAQPDGGGL